MDSGVCHEWLLIMASKFWAYFLSKREAAADPAEKNDDATLVMMMQYTTAYVNIDGAYHNWTTEHTTSYSLSETFFNPCSNKVASSQECVCDWSFNVKRKFHGFWRFLIFHDSWNFLFVVLWRRFWNRSLMWREHFMIFEDSWFFMIHEILFSCFSHEDDSETEA